MQEVALAALRQQAPLVDPTKLAPWLYRVALVQSLLHRRKQGRWRKLATRIAEKLQPADIDTRNVDPLERLLALEEHRDRHVVFVRPELVVEIALDGVQASTRYPGGVALRFARVKRYREDKRPDEADTIAALQALLPT